jgi:hypothetical protein
MRNSAILLPKIFAALLSCLHIVQGRICQQQEVQMIMSRPYTAMHKPHINYFFPFREESGSLPVILGDD